jgi:hypothetical protein
MAVTISLSTLLQVVGIALIAYVVYWIYDLFWVKPKAFQKFWSDQGVKGRSRARGCV